MCPGCCPAAATRSGGKSFKTVCTAERRSNPEKQDQRGAKHTYNQTQRQTNSTEPFTCVTKVCWQAVMATCKWAIIGLWRVITLLWFLRLLRYGSFFHIRLWWEGRTTKHLNTHTHSHKIAVLHYPFPCGSRGVYLLLHVKMTTGRDIIVRQRQVVGVQTGRREEWMQIIWDQQTLLELW